MVEIITIFIVGLILLLIFVISIGVGVAMGIYIYFSNYSLYTHTKDEEHYQLKIDSTEPTQNK